MRVFFPDREPAGEPRHTNKCYQRSPVRERRLTRGEQRCVFTGRITDFIHASESTARSWIGYMKHCALTEKIQLSVFNRDKYGGLSQTCQTTYFGLSKHCVTNICILCTAQSPCILL